MRILVADDNDVCRMLLAGVLMDAGFEVETVTNGRDALDRVRNGDIRLVISDWEMPGMTGEELCRSVRNDDALGYVYIILLTTHGAPHERLAGLVSGADDFVSKPFDTPELLARVRCGERVLALETREVTIFALAKLAESRDSETGAHLERVREYSRTLARDLCSRDEFAGRAEGDFVRLIYLTSPLHDVGKVGIPDSILLKPGKLDAREFEIMKSHTTLGAGTLAAALTRYPGVRFLQMARSIALHHHERFDGTGYPTGLEGEDIPLCARIVALADVYDALTSKRVYKEALSHDDARRSIAGESGKHFDPHVVRSFLFNEERFIEVNRSFGRAMAA
ncbi:MAG: HD domain-containing phosphohydrolase [Phycisphaerales bacterium]